MAKKKVVYKEPADYIPDEIQKKYKVGRYYEPPKEEKEQMNREFRELAKNK